MILKAKYTQTTEGFTLIELMIAIALFGVVISISLGSLVSLYDANNKAQSLSSSINNLNYAVDSMTRNIRFSDKYHCGSSGTLTDPKDCPLGSDFLAVNFKGQTIVYRYNTSAKTIERSDDGGNFYKSITGSDISIDYFKFFLQGSQDTFSSNGDTVQPLLRIVIKGHSGVKASSQTSFDIYTTVSQRSLDI